jgi:hypothetical protein
MTTPAGWYPDPGNPAWIRWWDGQAWTTNVQATADRSRHVVSPADEARSLEAELAQLRRDLVETREVLALQEVGIYRYSHPLETALAYKERLTKLDEEMRQVVKEGGAVTGTKQWAINGSQKEGARMVSDFCKLMLRAYNNEADNAVRALKPFMLDAAVQRLEKARTTIQKLGSAMHIEVTDRYHRLRVTELELTADYLAKREEEKEKEREARARMKEEEAVRRELERERERLEKERSHYESVVQALRAKGDDAAVEKLEAKLSELDKAISGVENREANTRAGYVYCISNIGAFGPGVVKIGLTRRLDPMDRVRELGDASVPFRFDVHALIFSEDAVGLETMLHQHFAERRVNMINAHREFFYASPVEVRTVLESVQGSLISFNEVPEALEWRQSESARGRGGGDPDAVEGVDAVDAA